MTDEARQIAARSRMVSEQLRARGLHDERVLAAMHDVPRDAFVPTTHGALAYDDSALPLPHGQTISQPYMVARAAELAQLQPTDRVLEVGLGSGYQAAVLSRLCAHVIGVELVPELAHGAEHKLRALGYDNVQVQVGDGSLGFAPGAPYDAIVVAAASPQAPAALVEQLRVGGRLVIPIGDRQLQTLCVVTRTQDAMHIEEHDRCVYVPLLGAAGFSH